MEKASFADESWRGNQWFRPKVLAHILSDKDLGWFFELVKITKEKNLYPGELKAHIVIDLLPELDYKLRNRIWQDLQNVIIIITDPREYLSTMGIKIYEDGAFQLKIEKRNIMIEPNDENYIYFVNSLQDYLSGRILLDSPISDIAHSISEIWFNFDIFPANVDSFFPNSILNTILSKMNKKETKKKIINSIKLFLRSHSAFFELRDPETKNKVLEKIKQKRPIFVSAYYHYELLSQSLSYDRFFDEGHSQSITIIKNIQDILIQAFNKHQIFCDSTPILPPKIIELDSKKDIRIQAADVAAGIARNIYETKGIKGLKERFNYIIFNGRKI